MSEVHEFELTDLRGARIRQTLKWVFSGPERLRPGKTRQALTEQAALEFATLAQRLRDRGHDPDKRSQLGAHYTDRDKIMLIVDPVITRPCLP